MADRFVRITLEKPYFNGLGEGERVLALRYGTEPARLINGGYVADGVDGISEAIPVSARLASMNAGGQPPRYLPGKPITYDLAWTDEDMRQVVVPDYVAMHYFGDWTLLPGEAAGITVERTYAAEKRRIATVWRGFKKEPRDRNIPNHWRSLRNVGPPDVPHVMIEQLDSALRRTTHAAYRPWEHFKWEQDCINIGLEGAGSEHIAPTQIIVTTDQLSAMVAEQVKLLMAQADAKTPRVAKAS